MYMKKLLDIAKLKKTKIIPKFDHYVNKKSKDTKPEVQTQKILDDLGIKYQKQFQIEKVFYDLYIPSKNLIIEVDGCFYHSKGVSYTLMNDHQKKTFKRDRYKEGLAAQHGYILKRIWEGEINKHSVKELLK